MHAQCAPKMPHGLGALKASSPSRGLCSAIHVPLTAWPVLHTCTSVLQPCKAYMSNVMVRD